MPLHTTPVRAPRLFPRTAGAQVARLLGLPIGGGGGPALEALATEGSPTAVELPEPLARRRSCDFSFAGLKTAVRLAIERAKSDDFAKANFEADVAASFQNRAIGHITRRLRYAMEGASRRGELGSLFAEGETRTLVLSGGVAANSELRSRVQATSCHRPPPTPAATSRPHLGDISDRRCATSRRRREVRAGDSRCRRRGCAQTTA